jgi:hypothetical protein
MTISQLVMRWEQAGVPSGFTVIHSSNVLPSPGPLQTFAQSLITYVPATFTLTVPNTGRLIDETTGKMTGIWSQGSQTSVVCTGVGPYAAASGAQVKWDTNGFVNGHRVAGMSYLVPIVSGQFTTSGILLTAFCTAVNNAATTLITGMAQSFVIWARPLYEKDANGVPTDVLKRPGSFHKVSTSTVPNKSAQLRGRRDN